ncbi:class I lanthipeptide [Chitinophaga flava]|nr:class I lanthipeptide [Chitinophaga flava]
MKKQANKKLLLKKIAVTKLQVNNPAAIKGGGPGGPQTSSIWICDGCGGKTTISCGGAGYPCE